MSALIYSFITVIHNILIGVYRRLSAVPHESWETVIPKVY
jgi:hypothetical protein